MYFALGKTVSLVTVFVWIRYLSVVLLPAGFFAAALLLELPPLTAAASAMLAPLISTDAWYGLDYSSYVTAGRGLFPQAVAAVLLLLQWLRISSAASRQVGLWRLLSGLPVFAISSGWIGAVTLCLLALLPDAAVARALRIRRTIFVGGVALLVSAFQLLPVWIDSPILNHSRWEQSWKWDSFGAVVVLKALFTGEVLDHGRLPVLSLLALLGAVVILWKLYREHCLPAPEGFVLSAAMLWLLVFFGRPTWGSLLLLLGATRDLHLHRVVGAVHIFRLAAAIRGNRWRQRAHGYSAGAWLPCWCSRRCCRNARDIRRAMKPMEPK